jgi:hypothetical protein
MHTRAAHKAGVLGCAVPRRQTSREPPPELDADMRAGDIADALRQLKFDHSEFNAIKIDADVRDFLVTALNARYAGRRS